MTRNDKNIYIYHQYSSILFFNRSADTLSVLCLITAPCAIAIIEPSPSPYLNFNSGIVKQIANNQIIFPQTSIASYDSVELEEAVTSNEMIGYQEATDNDSEATIDENYLRRLSDEECYDMLGLIIGQQVGGGPKGKAIYRTKSAIHKKQTSKEKKAASQERTKQRIKKNTKQLEELTEKVPSQTETETIVNKLTKTESLIKNYGAENIALVRFGYNQDKPKGAPEGFLAQNNRPLPKNPKAGSATSEIMDILKKHNIEPVTDPEHYGLTIEDDQGKQYINFYAHSENALFEEYDKLDSDIKDSVLEMDIVSLPHDFCDGKASK